MLCISASNLNRAGLRHCIATVTDIFSYLSIVPQPPHRPAHTPPSPRPNPPRLNPLFPSFTGLFATLPCALTPSTTLSSCVSTTTPPTISSPRVACSVSKLKMRSSSQTFSKRPSSACTKTWMRSSSANGDSVDVEMMMKYSVA